MNLYKRWFRPTPDSTWTIDLSFFDHFIGDLDSTTFSVELRFEQNPQPWMPNIFAAYTTETTRLGSTLIGREECVHIEKSLDYEAGDYPYGDTCEYYTLKMNIRLYKP